MWSALLTLLPLLVRIAGIILDKSGADAAEKKQVIDLITAAQNDPLTPVKIKDDIKNLRAKLKARMQEGKQKPNA